MNLAVTAKCLVRHKGTPVAARERIFSQFPAVITKNSFSRSVVLSAIERDHLTYGSLLLFPFLPDIFHDKRPPSIEWISSAILIVDCLCDTRRIVLSSDSSLRDFRITASLRLSRLLVGSSRSMNGAS